MSKEEQKEERLLVYREITNELGEVRVVCYDQATSRLERNFGYDENGRLHGFYQKWDSAGNLELNTKYQHGIEMGPRVAKLRGLYPDIWEHSSMGENGIWSEVIYSRSPDTTGYGQLVPKEEVQELLEAHAAELRERAEARNQFSPRGFVSEAIWDTLDDLMERMELNDYSFSNDLKEIFEEGIRAYDRGERFFNDLSKYGAGDVLGDFTYYSHTKDFYMRNIDDIDSFVKDFEKELGQPLSFDDPRYHYATRIVVEEVARRIGDDFQDFFRTRVLDNVEDISLEEAKEVMEKGGMAEVTEILQDYISFHEEDQELSQEVSTAKTVDDKEAKKITLKSKKKGGVKL